MIENPVTYRETELDVTDLKRLSFLSRSEEPLSAYDINTQLGFDFDASASLSKLKTAGLVRQVGTKPVRPRPFGYIGAPDVPTYKAIKTRTAEVLGTSRRSIK